jgi:hypothetical protein
MMPLESRLSISATAKLTQTQDLGSAVATAVKSLTVALASGTAAGQADKLFADTRSLAASANEDLDLAGTMLQDPLGANLTFVKVKGLLVAASAANTNNVVVGAAASNAWTALLGATGTVTVRPGAVFAAFAGAADANGYAVVASTGDLLRIANSAGGSTVSYDIVVLGTSA